MDLLSCYAHGLDHFILSLFKGDLRTLDSHLSNLLIFEQDVKWLQTITKMPILVKGVITAEDSKKA